MEDILNLQRKYECGEIHENELSEEEIKKLENLYRKQIEEKRKNLKVYKTEILKYMKKLKK